MLILSQENKKKPNAVFLDRDGVINRVVYRDGSLQSPRRFEDLEIIGGIESPLKELRDIGFWNIIVTNQPDIRRSLLSMEELKKMHDHIKSTLPIDGIVTCPHDDRDRCMCRKPRPGMILTSARLMSIDLRRSYMIGDTWKDVSAGLSAGCGTLIMDAPYNRDVTADFRVRSLDEAVVAIREAVRRSQAL
jgi:D-glycero-D-manno-heptose 1,7-bisphosphate phosphatase